MLEVHASIFDNSSQENVSCQVAIVPLVYPFPISCYSLSCWSAAAMLGDRSASASRPSHIDYNRSTFHSKHIFYLFPHALLYTV